MLLITAALAEELNVALELCKHPARTSRAGIRVVQANAGQNPVFLLKTGVGPARAGSRLEKLLAELQPSEILTIGYAGALDASLEVGDLVIPREASLFGDPDSNLQPLTEIATTGSWQLSRSVELFEAAGRAGISASRGSILTSPYIIGDPVQKKILRNRFGSAAIDMESAALARVAALRGIPYGCARAISDGANDEFLAPISYDPASNPLNRALKVVAAGNWLKRYQGWKDRASIARATLRRFLSCYLLRK